MQDNFIYTQKRFNDRSLCKSTQRELKTIQLYSENYPALVSTLYNSVLKYTPMSTQLWSMVHISHKVQLCGCTTIQTGGLLQLYT